MSITTETKTGVAFGLNKGHVVTKRAKVVRPSEKRTRGARARFVKSVVRSVAGYSTYEKRAMELMSSGGANGNKRAMRLIKKRLGSLKRAKRKFNELSNVSDQ